MTYYSREILEQYLKDTRFNKILDIIDETEPYLTTGKTVPANINIRFCRNCEYFIPDHPIINPDGDSGYCEYRTDFYVLDDEPIDWYYTNINKFCNENDILEKDE